MAQDNRRIDIYIRTGDADKSGDGSGSKKKKEDGVVAKDSKATEYINSLLSFHTAEKVGHEIYDLAVDTANKVFSGNDDYIGRRNLSIATSSIGKAVSFGLALKTGAIIGGPAGIAVAAVTYTAKAAWDVYKMNYEQETEIKKRDAELSFTRERSGYSLVSGSIGENR